MSPELISSYVVNLILIARAILDYLKTAADNKAQLREKDEMIHRLKSQKEKITEKYFKLKEKYETTI